MEEQSRHARTLLDEVTKGTEQRAQGLARRKRLGQFGMNEPLKLASHQAQHRKEDALTRPEVLEQRWLGHPHVASDTPSAQLGNRHIPQEIQSRTSNLDSPLLGTLPRSLRTI